MSQPPEEESARPLRDVDLRAAERGVWLVKVPKYLSEKWKRASGKGEVGKLKIISTKIPGAQPEVTFSMNEAQAQVQVPGRGTATPKEHKFKLTGVGNQNLVVFSENKGEGTTAAEITERIAIEGKVIQRAECQPVVDKSYMQLKKRHVEDSNKPKREIKQITGVVTTYKPVSNHAANIEHEKKIKEGGKRIRDERDVVTNKLFEIFEKHQYYNIQDLVRLTNQPVHPSHYFGGRGRQPLGGGIFAAFPF
ncbi:hypothetical protein DPMN_138952 [Dreissena polymorpha]|uniref:General transcription factor IIF subunit 2 n=1 Tax=Dreissena polymorpha TaxID=45954 RepID=A0A9D4JJ15_DREPO|nr:hypothetical protein DPMN_138952 [Dreissena polymorpha]